MQFFESTPIGRIINRFSKDLSSVEFYLPISFKDFVWCTLDLLTTCTLISISTPYFLTALIPLFILYLFLQVNFSLDFFISFQALYRKKFKRYYVSSCSKLKRLEATSKSPIFSHLGETLNGISVIKAYGVQERFVKELDKRIDENSKYFYANNDIDR